MEATTTTPAPEKFTAKELVTDQEVRWCPGCGDFGVLAAVQKALVELPKLTFFTQLADVTSMPKNYGKKIKRYHYMPLLDDRNINDQGLDAAGASYAGGNLYGSSKDIGTIPGKMPVLSETGGRVNRVGFKRIELEGTLEKFGFFDEYTQESMDFDTDEQLLEQHRDGASTEDAFWALVVDDIAAACGQLRVEVEGKRRKATAARVSPSPQSPPRRS